MTEIMLRVLSTRNLEINDNVKAQGQAFATATQLVDEDTSRYDEGLFEPDNPGVDFLLGHLPVV